MPKIIITGPECSGKTTLSKSLSKYFNSKLVNEFARIYLIKKNNKYNFESILEIAQNQHKIENQKSNTTLQTTLHWISNQTTTTTITLTITTATTAHSTEIYLQIQPPQSFRNRIIFFQMRNERS